MHLNTHRLVKSETCDPRVWKGTHAKEHFWLGCIVRIPKESSYDSRIILTLTKVNEKINYLLFSKGKMSASSISYRGCCLLQPPLRLGSPLEDCFWKSGQNKQKILHKCNIWISGIKYTRWDRSRIIKTVLLRAKDFFSYLFYLSPNKRWLDLNSSHSKLNQNIHYYTWWRSFGCCLVSCGCGQETMPPSPWLWRGLFTWSKFVLLPWTTAASIWWRNPGKHTRGYWEMIPLNFPLFWVFLCLLIC